MGTEARSQSDSALLLVMRPCPSSVHYRPFLDRSNGPALLPWCAQTFRQQAPGRALHALVTPWEHALYLPALEAAGFVVHTDPLDSEIRALSRTLAKTGLRRATVVTPEAALLPARTLEQAWQSHQDTGSDFSIVDGVPLDIAPVGVVAEAMESIIPFVETMKRLVTSLPTSVTAAIGLVEAASAHNGSAGGPTIRRLMLPAIAGVTMPPTAGVDGATAVAAVRRAIAHGQPYLEALLEEQNAAPLGEDECVTASLPGPDSLRSRILYVSDCCAFTGGHRSLCALVRNLDRDQVEPFAWVSFDGLFAQHLRELGCRVICPNDSIRTPNRRNFHRALAIIRTIRPDVIHISDFSGMGIIHAAKALGIPVVFHVRVPGAHLLREALEVADHIVCVSNYTCRDVRRVIGRHEGVSVVHSGVPTARVTTGKLAARDELGLAHSDQVVLMVGRYHPIKRHDVFLRAMATLRERYPHLKGVLVGETDVALSTLEIVQRLIVQLGLQQTIRLEGFQADMSRLYAAADVNVLCSDSEPLGMSALEAMCAGVPTVICAHGELAELLADGDGALVVPAGDHFSLAGAIESILHKPDLARRLSENGRQFVTANFDEAATSRAMSEIYRQLLAKTVDIADYAAARG